jgi:hypothetical protein
MNSRVDRQARQVMLPVRAIINRPPALGVWCVRRPAE